MNRLIDALERLEPFPPPPGPGPAPFGQPYIPARGGIDAPETLVTHNWDALDRATRAHADLQNDLAEFVWSRGIETVTPRPGIDPAFDVGWRCSLGLVVAEVKTVTVHNRRQQIRLGLGQVIDYRWNVAQVHPGPVIGVLAIDEPLRVDELEFCGSVGIVATSPHDFEEDLYDFLDGIE